MSEKRSLGRSPWAPLVYPVFRTLWIAAIFSNLGTLVQAVGASWLMTSMATSPFLIALVQTANSLPVFLLSLPAGALADVLDRRKLIMAMQAWMLLMAILLGFLTFAGAMTPVVLLSLLFALGLGAALNAPAWQAIVGELVPRTHLASAIALNSAGFNLARAIGPAIGGLLIATAGVGITFLLNALSYLGVLWVLSTWRREAGKSDLPPETILEAMRGGIRYVRYSPPIHAVLIRAGTFVFFGCTLWALLPVIARFSLGLGPTGYGITLGSFGLGAVTGAALLPRIRMKWSIDRTLVSFTMLFAVAALVPVISMQLVPVIGAVFVTGAAWLVLFSSYNSAVQLATPTWVRGRAVAVYLLTTFGGLSLGSALWGAVTSLAGMPVALSVSSGLLLASLLLTHRFRLESIESLKVDIVQRTPSEIEAVQSCHASKPLKVSIKYRIAPHAVSEFEAVMQEMWLLRMRSGAIAWTLQRETTEHATFVETCLFRTWLDYQRVQERMTISDQELEMSAMSYHQAPEPPKPDFDFEEKVDGLRDVRQESR